MRNKSPKKPNPNGRAALACKPWQLLLLAAALVGYSTQAAPTLTDVDVGAPSNPGSMTTAADGKITISGGGDDIWNASDNFHYAYLKVTGDFDYVMKVESLVGNSGDGGWSKAELMARVEDPAQPGVGPQGGDPHISNMTTRKASDTADGVPAGVNYRGPQWRANRDGLSTWTTPSPGFPPNMPDNWVRLERLGSVFYMYTSNDGKTWSMYSPYDPQGWDTAGSWPPGTDNPTEAFFTAAWPSAVFLGIAVTSHNDAADPNTVAVISNFGPYTQTPPAIATQPPATAAVAAGSPLKLSVVTTGDPVHYQWMKEGKAVTTNGLGATYTVDRAAESDSGSYTVRVYGAGKEVVSSASVVTVTQDVTPPTIVSIDPALTFDGITIHFNEPLDSASAATLANYAIDGGLTLSAPVFQNQQDVKLTTTKQTADKKYTLTVNNVKDLAGNAIAAGTKVTFLPANVTTGLAAYWSFDGNLNDSIKDFNGTARGSTPIAYIDGKAGFGKALQLDGTNYVEVTGGNSADNLTFVGGSVSIAGWFKVGTFDKSWQALVARGEGSSWRVARNNADSSMSYAGGLTDVLGVTDVTDGNWHHFVAMSDPAGSSGAWGTALFIDGVLDSSIEGDAVLTRNSANNVMIGENPDALGRQWNGQIDDIGIWNRVLSDTEIATLYAGGTGKALGTLLPPPANLPITATIARAGSTLTIQWSPTGGTLESSPTLGPTPTWTAVGAANPATITIGANSAFYRVRQ